MPSLFPYCSPVSFTAYDGHDSTVYQVWEQLRLTAFLSFFLHWSLESLLQTLWYVLFNILLHGAEIKWQVKNQVLINIKWCT